MLMFKMLHFIVRGARFGEDANLLDSTMLTERLELAATASTDVLFRHFGSSDQGLNREAVVLSRQDYGRNVVSADHQNALRRRLTRAAAFVQGMLGTTAAEYVANLAKATAHVARSAFGERDLASSELVVGDIVRFSAGDLVPADVRLIDAHELLADESVLAGRRTVSPKDAARLRCAYTPGECSNILFAGSRIAGGSGRGIVVAVGEDTLQMRTMAAPNPSPIARAALSA